MSTNTILAALLWTTILALYIYFCYRIMTRKSFYSKSFNIALVAMALITAAIILTIQSSIVVSLGMVGALSIVRFRTAIKEPLDIAFLFWAIAAGIVLAAGLIPLAVFGSVIIGVILLIFANHNDSANPYIMVLRLADSDAEKSAVEYLTGSTKRCVTKSKTVQKGSVELTMEVRLKDSSTDFVNALADMKGVESAVLVSYNGDYMG
jgi:uncharacterized membrane protein YhiD involved in acid resistance